LTPRNNWLADLHDHVHTLGLSLAAKKLLAGKLQLSGDISVAHATTDSTFGGCNYANIPLVVVGASAGAVAAFCIPAVPLPTVTTKAFDLRLVADLALQKLSSLHVGYLYRYMYSQDWAYDGLQAGRLTQLLPSYEQSPNYSVHALALTYVRRFN
jgi:hypothetical protein